MAETTRLALTTAQIDHTMCEPSLITLVHGSNWFGIKPPSKPTRKRAAGSTNSTRSQKSFNTRVSEMSNTIATVCPSTKLTVPRWVPPSLQLSAVSRRHTTNTAVEIRTL